ncbi:MAG: hypothetical protein ACR2JV_05610 [Gaiellales bacterium]
MDPNADGTNGDPRTSLELAAERLRITLRAAAGSGMSVAELAQATGLSEDEVDAILTGD